MAKDLIQVFKQVAVWAKGAPLQAAFLGLVLFFLLPYLLNGTARSVPGPFLAKFTDFWLLKQAVNGNRFEVVHELHKKHGKFVRLAPNHISIADHKALNAVYGHSTGTQKSLYYDAFVPPKPFPRGLFNTRDRQEHSRKRKIVSHTFAPKSITAFEPFIRRETQLLLDFCDEKCKQAQEKQSQGPRGLKGYALVNALEILNFWAFDTIGILAFGKPFGMLETGKDEARVEYEGPSGKKVDYVPAIQTINERGEYSASMGVAPVWIRSYLAKLPWFAKRLRSVKALTGIALARVNDRLVNGSDRDDLLSKLQNARDDTGEAMGKMELTAEALTQLIAGSDTTSNTSTAILYHVVKHPQVYQKLRRELDEHLKETEDVPLNSDVESLPYLQAVINESLRFHSTSSLGLPRIIPPGGSTVCGKFFPSGTVLSCPAYTIHREKEIWGDDAEEYNPDRWLENDRKELEKAFIPFSVGPRACVGRNVALMELNIVVGALFKRYDFELPQGSETKMDTIEGFLRKPTALPTLMKRRTQMID